MFLFDHGNPAVTNDYSGNQTRKGRNAEPYPVFRPNQAGIQDTKQQRGDTGPQEGTQDRGKCGFHGNILRKIIHTDGHQRSYSACAAARFNR